MAKENKINPYLLFLASVLLLGAGFLMKSFPILVFAGIAPLFAIADHADEKNFWTKLELVGAAWLIALLAWYSFDYSRILHISIQTIIIMIAFAAFTFSRRALGTRFGKLPLIFFLLALEYVTLSIHHFDFFLADAVELKTGWLRWTRHTGYLGASLWILLANFFLYLGIFRNGLKLPYLAVCVIVIVGPILYSYTLQSEPVTRMEMLRAYAISLDPVKSPYAERGEWIPRTAAWISVLILLSAIVKEIIRKK